MPVNLVLTSAQALGLLAVLVGVALALPLWGALVVDGALVLAAATAAEVVATRQRGAHPDRRSGSNAAGVV